MSVVEEIKQRLDIVDVVSQTVKLRRAGKSYSGFCPFHPNTRTPAFYVFPETQSWHCFGACDTGGDLFTFVMKRDRLDFGEALKALAERAGVELHREGAGEVQRQVLLDMHAAAALYYHYLLKTHAAAQFSREYLERRHITRDSIDNFQLGFAPGGYASLKEHLEGKGFNAKDMERAGLVIANESGVGYHDRFRGRLMFPIRNRRGQVIAFGARALETEQQPKYLNSPDTPLFSKGEVLYGLDAARDAIRAENLAVIVEGYTDVIVAHQEGFKNVVASLGTALTEKQLSQLLRLTKRYALALDADAAGEAATERGLELARTALTRKQVPVPVGPGLIGFEERLEAELLVIALPAGSDPDEVILQDRERWRNLVEHAVPLVDFYFETQTRALDLKSAHGKSEAVRRLLPILGEISDAVQRAHYTQKLARLVQMDERELSRQLKARPLKTKSAEGQAAPPEARPVARYDEHLLALAIYQPQLLRRVQFLRADDFQDAAAREIWLALQKFADAPEDVTLDELLEGLSDPTRAAGERLRKQAHGFEFPELEAARELEAAAYRLRLQRYRDELTQLQYVLAEATAEEKQTLYARADTLRARVAEAQRALQARTVLRSGPPAAWAPQAIRGKDD